MRDAADALVPLLLERGADPEKEGYQGITPISVAERKGNIRLKATLLMLLLRTTGTSITAATEC
jgi:hypothetical protein